MEGGGKLHVSVMEANDSQISPTWTMCTERNRAVWVHGAEDLPQHPPADVCQVTNTVQSDGCWQKTTPRGHSFSSERERHPAHLLPHVTALNLIISYSIFIFLQMSSHYRTAIGTQSTKEDMWLRKPSGTVKSFSDPEHNTHKRAEWRPPHGQSF